MQSEIEHEGVRIFVKWSTDMPLENVRQYVLADLATRNEMPDRPRLIEHCGVEYWAEAAQAKKHATPAKATSGRKKSK